MSFFSKDSVMKGEWKEEVERLQECDDISRQNISYLRFSLSGLRLISILIY